MIKKILILTLLSTLGLKSFSQSNPKNPIVTGVKAGLNLSNLSSGDYSQQMKPSFHAGGFVEIPLSYYKQFAVQIELMYSNQGYKGKEFDIRDDNTGKVVSTNKLDDVSLHYLNIPIMFKYYIQNNFAIEFGPQIGFLMDANGEFDLYKYNDYAIYFTNFTSNLDREMYLQGYRSKDFKDYYESIDYGLSLGLSYNFENGAYISGRYYMGLNDVYKADNNFTQIVIPEGMPELIVNEINAINNNFNFKSSKNSVFQISVGYRF